MSSSFIRVPYRVEDPYSGVFNRARVVLCSNRAVLKCTLHSTPMATSTFSQPPAFDFAHPDRYRRWKEPFQRYREATGLDKKEGPIQISTLVYSMGDRAEDILSSFTLSDKLRQEQIRCRAGTVRETLHEETKCNI